LPATDGADVIVPLPPTDGAGVIVPLPPTDGAGVPDTGGILGTTGGLVVDTGGSVLVTGGGVMGTLAIVGGGVSGSHPPTGGGVGVGAIKLVGLGVDGGSGTDSLVKDTSKEVPSTLVMVTVQGSVTNPAASAKIQKMTDNSPSLAFSSRVPYASSKTSAPMIKAPISSQPGQGLTTLKLKMTSLEV
jgi:hypothetical protein